MAVARRLSGAERRRPRARGIRGRVGRIDLASLAGGDEAANGGVSVAP